MGIADLQQKLPRPTAPVASPQRLFGARTVLRSLLMVLLLGLAVSVMAYQVPPTGRVLVGWLGDRLFLDTSSGLGADALAQGALFADELTPDSPTQRSRWTRKHAQIVLPNIGAGSELELTLVAQGWPVDVVNVAAQQPTVTVRANGAVVGVFQPRSSWGEHSFRVPAARTGDDLVIDLDADQTFAASEAFAGDPRPKGVRLAELRVRAVAADPAALYVPAWSAVALLCVGGLLLYLLLAKLLRAAAPVYVLTALGVGLAGLGLAVARIWMGAALSAALLVLATLLALAWQRDLLALARALIRRYTQGRTLGYGLVAGALVLFSYALAQLFGWFGTFGRPLFWQIFPDSLLFGLLGAGLLALVLVRGREGLPRLADGIVGALGSRRGAALLLGLFAAVWLGYEAVVVFALPYVGHADYADNAVVARNLAAGRGWVVDYVSQFYRLYPDLTRPQETWPLLQPVWIAPFFALFGPSNWAAKLPNLIFNAILLLLVYSIGARLWDRRVGLTAAIFLLTNYLFFRLTIYVSNDLAFVVLSVGALYTLYRSQVASREAQEAGRLQDLRWLLLSGLLTGLMMLQKPSGAMIALGMGLWLLGQQATGNRQQAAVERWSFAALSHFGLRVVSVVLPWAVIALLVLSPYLVRNVLLFDGRPVFSTESYDAWVLGYRGRNAWDDIYRVFAPELGGLGLPDRSWILRWGFDATLDKLITQISSLRDYLLPVWIGLPREIGWLFGSNEAKNIASGVGAWLALIGLVGGLRFRRPLLGLIAAAYAPYMVFMLTYWRADEERYWVILLPWLLLFAAWMIWAGYDKLATVGDRRWAPLGLILALVAVGSVVGFSRADVARKVSVEPGPTLWAPDLAAYAWLDANLPPGAAVMTRIPWQLNWHTERAALMIPNTADREELLRIAQHYGVEYLVLENQQRVKGDAGRLLAPLLDHNNQVGAVVDGFELLYASPTADFRAFIYRLPPTP